MFEIRMLTIDLFAVANLLVEIAILGLLKEYINKPLIYCNFKQSLQ